MNGGNIFPKKERLCSRKAIDALFAAGNKSLTAYPLRVVYKPVSPEDKLQILVSVSKRRLRHAVDRNRAKRLIREAWRMNRDLLDSCPPFHLAFIWQADEPQTQDIINRKMRSLLHRMAEALC
ncbi:MAG: ribonuclease P protein component [Bacteroidaceae bacterium]|nr:ribonuclease P protein component [Bacteroidaceae bacterium]